MNYPALAVATLQLVDKVSVPATAENAKGITAIHEMLGAISRGELILTQPPAPKPAKD